MAYYSTMGNLTVANSSPHTNVTIIGGGSGYGISGYTLATTATSGATWATTGATLNTSTPSIQVQGNAEFNGKVMINGADLAATLHAIQDRLSILIPDPKRLEKYEALKQAYEHYKTLEALCVEQDNTDK